VIRRGYGLNYNGEQVAISANIFQNPGLAVSPSFVMATPTSPNPGIVYATSSGTNNLNGYPANPNTIVTFGPNGLPTTGTVNVQIFPNTLPTTRVHHYSADVQYDLGHQLIASLGYQGSLSRDIYFHQNPLAVPATLGDPFNPQIGGGDNWSLNGRANYNAMLAELKHQFARQFSADASIHLVEVHGHEFRSIFGATPTRFDLGLNYGRCDYNVGKAFKVFGVWQPVFFQRQQWLARKDRRWLVP